MTTPTPNPITQQLESQLRDIALPEPVSWWPLAAGWWVVIALLVLTALVSIYYWLRHRAANKHRRLALQHLEEALTLYQQHADSQAYLQNVNQVLKRTLLSAPLNNNRSIATVSGQAWINMLEAFAPTVLSSSTKSALSSGLYQRPDSSMPSLDILSIHSDLCAWVQRYSTAQAAQHQHKHQSATLKQGHTNEGGAQ